MNQLVSFTSASRDEPVAFDPADVFTIDFHGMTPHGRDITSVQLRTPSGELVDRHLLASPADVIEAVNAARAEQP